MSSEIQVIIIVPISCSKVILYCACRIKIDKRCPINKGFRGKIIGNVFGNVDETSCLFAVYVDAVFQRTPWRQFLLAVLFPGLF